VTDRDIGDSNGRPEESGRPDHIVSINPLAGIADIEEELDRAARISKFQRNERWENSRQVFVLFCFSVISLALVIGFAWSVWVLTPSDEGQQIEIARWILATEIGGLVAGLIGFWAIKTFEK
jgi:hypothetical protein